MKRSTQFLSVVVLFFFLSGCSEKDQSVVTPSETQAPQASIQGLARPQSHVNLIPLPKPRPTVDFRNATSGGLISARFGGVVSIKFKYPSLSGKTVVLTALFYVPPGAVDKDRYLTMSLDDKYLGVKFKPGGLKFNVPAKLDFSASGLDLTVVPIGMPISLYYVDQFTSTFEKQNASAIWASRFQGTLVCKNGQISHFSRYAFGY